MNEIDKIRKKFTPFIPGGFDIQPKFEQYNISRPYAFNDQVLPPYNWPNVGFNTINVIGNQYPALWSVYACPGTIVGFLTANRPTTMSCVSAGGPTYQYLRNSGYAVAEIVGAWVTAGSIAGAGLNWHIDTIDGVDYFFVPSGFNLSASTVPDVYDWPGNYIFARFYFQFVHGYLNGMAINKWDGSFRYGTISSSGFNVSNQDGNFTNYITALYVSSLLSPLNQNGVGQPSTVRDNRNGWTTQDPLPQFFCNVVPGRGEGDAASEPIRALGQFDGWLLVPESTKNLYQPTYTFNVL